MDLRKWPWLQILPGIILLVIIATGVISYEYLPAEVASHWGINGDVDGYSSKLSFSLGIIILSSVMIPLLMVLPKIDPLRKNYKEFRSYYDSFVIVMSLLLLDIYVQTVAYNLGVDLNPAQLVPLAVGAVFIYIACMLPHVKQNWFVGIRTPWTLSSEEVWDKTHKAGAYVFAGMGFVLAITGFVGDLGLYIFLASVVIGVVGLFGYSYFEFKKNDRRKRL